MPLTTATAAIAATATATTASSAASSTTPHGGQALPREAPKSNASTPSFQQRNGNRVHLPGETGSTVLCSTCGRGPPEDVRAKDPTAPSLPSLPQKSNAHTPSFQQRIGNRVHLPGETGSTVLCSTCGRGPPEDVRAKDPTAPSLPSLPQKSNAHTPSFQQRNGNRVHLHGETGSTVLCSTCKRSA